MERLTDRSEMPFGKHKGTLMINVPSDYLLWLHQQDWLEEQWQGVHGYIEDNFDALIMEVEHKRNLGVE